MQSHTSRDAVHHSNYYQAVDMARVIAIHFFLLLFLAVSHVAFLSGLDASELEDTSASSSVSLRVSFMKPYVDFVLSPESASIADAMRGENSVQYSPNEAVDMSLLLMIKNFGIQYSGRLNSFAGDEDTYGRTDYMDLHGFGYAYNIAIDIVYQKYKGFYMDDPGSHIPSWNSGDPYPQRRDLQVTTMGLNYFYIFSPGNFSFRAAFNQTQRQRKSAGSFIFLISPFSYKVESDSSLTPAGEDVLYGRDAGFFRGSFTTLSAAPGFFYTLVFESDFFITVGAFAGGGVQQYLYETALEDMRGNSYMYKVNGRISTGYNTDNYYLGFSANYDYAYLKMKESAISFTIFYGELYGGIRF